MKTILDNIKTVIAILAAVISLMVWTFNYHASLATSEELKEKTLAIHLKVSQSDLDRKISIVETKVLIYTLIGVEKLGPVEKGRYERANLRLVALENQRDDLVGVPGG